MDSKLELVQIGGLVDPPHWKNLDELYGNSYSNAEFPGGLPSPDAAKPMDASRRNFLSLMGFSLVVAGLSGCRAPVQNAIPLVAGSDQIAPGVSNWYATTCRGCAASCSLLVKQRDGRPIKIEGNTASDLFGGGTCARGQATVLSLYDDERLHGPLWHGKPAKWKDVDRHILEALNAARGSEQRVVLLSGTITSPSTLDIIEAWRKQLPNFHHVIYDALSLSALRAAHNRAFGRAMVPHYSFHKARVIVSLEADFLGTWLSPVEFTRQYARSRRPEGSPSLHVQFESGLSLTGSNADVRVPVIPSQLGRVAVVLLARIAKKSGISDVPQLDDPIEPQKLDAIAAELWKHRGASLVVSGIQDVAVQDVVIAINMLLGNIGETIDIAAPSLQAAGDDAAMAELVEEMNRGNIHTLVLYGVNPAYDYPDADKFLKGLERTTLSISLSDRMDETSSHVHAVCPDHHFLEAWGDAQPVEGHYSLAQPLIAPLFETRAAQESLLRWAGVAQPNYYEYLREFWRKNLLPRQAQFQIFDSFWDDSLQRGVAVFPNKATRAPAYRGDWKTSAKKVLAAKQIAREGFELCFYPSVALGDGSLANNPWLQELPDPISKVNWGNYAAIAPRIAEQLHLSNGDVIALSTEKGKVEVPVFIQPGQDWRTISIALGYGRSKAGKAAQGVGVNLYPLTSMRDGFRSYSASATLEKTGRHEEVTSTQADFSLEGRPIVLETTFEELRTAKGNQAEREALPSLWPEQAQGEHWWGMAIDMNACTGCSACVIACQAENNVPVVGKDEVRRNRIMHWIRIDHYYSGREENPRSTYQPMMCQHCANAPCETVCPVLATTTSSEGLNQQVYNRCIGTRYCANNCPYKVRRFNWFQYAQNPKFDFTLENDLARMVLNPDVTVRSRGVMEKCSLCVQRIQLAKNVALQGNRGLVDGDIQTACQQACPAYAIVFGDLKDPNSRASQLRRSRRHYRVLETLGTRPNVGFLKKVRASLGIA